ncbi:TRAP transporter substrate-binding protein [Methylopila sp. Yamaguchi]|uniref:TRAP transporter substrate-binding protein n=1 Tax=Methylopila sp. Yamaguchi TaxID=1437817 RepID=UPI000CC34A43|nr:TRAP transporter substrate-binding protein [Methylopila sp. Yamaguchi]GBD50255.1 TRAP dicarboxylate transporter subunit DctP [Methylopila sp. Yamaguchi]
MTALSRRAVIAGGVAATAFVAAGSRARAQAPLKLRFGHPHPEVDAFHKGGLRFAELVKEKTGGRIVVEVYANGALGNDPTMIASVRGGTLDICLTGNPFFTGLAPKLNVLDLPYLFNDRAHVAAVLDGPIGDDLREGLSGSNLKALSTWEVGWRNLTNNRRAVKTPADVKGLKIRTTPNPAHIQAFRLLGAVPTPMAFTELFTALEMGSIDGQENPVTLILNAKFFEVQKHLSLTRHAFTTAPLVMNKTKFDGLSEDLRAALVSAAREAAVVQRQMNVEGEKVAVAELKNDGMKVVEDIDVGAFRALVADAVKAEYVAKFGPELVDKITSAAS